MRFDDELLVDIGGLNRKINHVNPYDTIYFSAILRIMMDMTVKSRPSFILVAPPFDGPNDVEFHYDLPWFEGYVQN